jgi:hypothetical protein
MIFFAFDSLRKSLADALLQAKYFFPPREKNIPVYTRPSLVSISLRTAGMT